MKVCKVLIIMAAAVLTVTGGFAATVYVTTTGTDSPTCGAQGSPCASIQYAYENVAEDNDTILVGQGTYLECLQLSAPFVIAPTEPQRSVNLLAEAFVAGTPSTRSLTVINGTGLCAGRSVVELGGADSSITGFTITGGTASGIFPNGGATITNNIITTNDSPSGAGIYIYPKACYYGSVDVVVENNRIVDNSAFSSGDPDLTGRGGGVFVRARSESFRAGDPILEDGCVGGAPTITIQNNEVENNDSEVDGGGMFVFTNTEELFATSITITQNVIRNNAAGQTSPSESSGFGGGVYATTFGFGNETIEIANNTVQLNTATGYGGGIYGRVSAYYLADHDVNVHDNTITENTGEIGGGALMALSVLDLEPDQTINVQFTQNTVTGNHAETTLSSSYPESGVGGGMSLFTFSRRTTAPNVDFVVADNRIRNNTAELDGGGVEILVIAESENLDDPMDTVYSPARPVMQFRNNLVAANEVSNAANTDGVGGGVFAFLQSFGGEPGSPADHSIATLDFNLNTVADNTAACCPSFDVSGGVELESYTGFDSGGSEGESVFSMSSSIVSDNSGYGLGGPTPGSGGIYTPGTSGSPPDTSNFSVDVTYSDVYGNGTANYEDWIGDRTNTPNAFNISADPQLNATTYIPEPCSPTLDGADPLVDYSLEPDPDGGQANIGHTGGTAQATPSLADINGDSAADGIDVLRLAVAFGSMFGEPRWNDAADLDGSGKVDGDDLALLAADFGDVCP